MMQIRHDPDADALKIKLSSHAYERSQMITPSCILDFDEDGNVIGIEILNVSKQVDAPNQISYVDISRKVSEPK
jgi:uncharacterized protein YuzE